LERATASMILTKKEHASPFNLGFFPSVLLTYLMMCPTTNLGGTVLQIKMTNLVSGSENLESPTFYII
jgi:hypothetical protein